MTGEVKNIKSDIVISTDGATSAVRLEMQKIPRFNFHRSTKITDIKNLLFLPAKTEVFRWKKMLFISGREDLFMLIALPNPDGSYTCMLFLAYDISPMRR